MHIWWMLLLAAGCGRAGFDPVEVDDVGPDADLAASTTDCTDVDLGSALGPEVMAGNSAGGRNLLAGCGGDGNEITHAWAAPATGRYRIDTCGSDPSWNASLSVRDGACTGELLACSADACDSVTGFHGIVTLDLEAGRPIVIVVDATTPAWDGDYRLGIEQI